MSAVSIPTKLGLNLGSLGLLHSHRTFKRASRGRRHYFRLFWQFTARPPSSDS
jgi:hypothetical protein